MIAQRPDNPYPVDSTYHACCHAIGGHGPDCRTPALDRLRAAIAEVDPAALTAADARALLELFASAAESDSPFGLRMQAHNPVGGGK